MSLSVLKIAEWTRSNSTDAGEGLVLIDSRDIIYTKQESPGETGTEYLKKVVIDLENKTASETVLYTATDGIAYAGLKIFGKNITTRRFGAYGMVGGDCDHKGDIIDLDDPSKILCLCDGASNCNLTSNIAKIGYDPVSGYLVCGGGCGGRWIWIIDPSDLSIIGRVSESGIRDKNYGRIEVVPRDDEKVFIVSGLGSGSGSQYYRIGLVDLDDIIENAPSYPNVDDLGSWQELISGTDHYSASWIRGYSNGSKISLYFSDAKALFDPVNNNITVLSHGLPIRPFSYKRWFAVDDSNKIYKIYDDDGESELASINETDTYDRRSHTLWFVLLTDTSTQKVIYKALSPDGNVIPIPEWDLVNNKFRVIDLLTGNPISIDVYLMWSRLQYSLAEFTSYPYIANNRISTMTVSDWTPIPNPPTNNVKVLYIAPKLI